MFFTIVFTIAGSTLAYWSWQTSEAQKTEVTFTVTKDFECAADGGGSITNTVEGFPKLNISKGAILNLINGTIK